MVCIVVVYDMYTRYLWYVKQVFKVYGVGF